MTAVLVNGNPETSAIWDRLVEHLNRADVIRLSPPGFGSPIPNGFACTAPAYRDWLISQLEAQPEPVDLVGHDLGGSTVIAVAMARPDLIRSWVSDSLGVFDPEYRWHDLARQWQTPEVGEQSVEQLMGGTSSDRVQRMVANGIDESIAAQLAAAQGPEMGRAILAFYRSATDAVLAETGRHLALAAARPGLAVIGTEDHFVGSEEMRRRAAARAGARVQVFEGLGHWWMVQDPGRAARALTEFWANPTRA